MTLKHAKPLHFVSSMWTSLIPDLPKAAPFPLFWRWLNVTSSESQPHSRSSPPHYLSLSFLSSAKITHWIYYCLKPILAWTLLKSRSLLCLLWKLELMLSTQGTLRRWTFVGQMAFWKSYSLLKVLEAAFFMRNALENPSIMGINHLKTFKRWVLPVSWSF